MGIERQFEQEPMYRPQQRVSPPTADGGIIRVGAMERHPGPDSSIAGDAPFTRPESRSAVVPSESSDARSLAYPDQRTDVAVARADQPRPRPSPAPTLDRELVDARRSTILGTPAAARFLTRQVIRTEVTDLAREAETDGQTKLVVAVNLTPRAPEARDNLQMDGSTCKVVDAGVFAPGGLIENLPPKHAAAALAAATAGGSKETAAVHNDIIRGVTKAVTPRLNPDTGEIEKAQPNLQEIAEGVGVWDRARIGEGHPEDPVALDQVQITNLQKMANTDRLEVTKGQVSQLRTRLDRDVIGDEEDFQNSPYVLDQEEQLFPALESGRPAEVPNVQVTRISVSPDSTGSQLDADVHAAGVGALAIVAGTPQGRPERLVIEGANELIKRAPEVLDEIETVCANQEPPIPLTLVFGGEANAQMAPFVRGKVVVAVGDEPLDYQRAEELGKLLPAVPRADLASESHNEGDSANTNVGKTVNKGYDPDKTKASAGTSATTGAAKGVTSGYAATVQHSVRPPRGHELTKGVRPWQAVGYNPDGTFMGKYDLRQRGIKIGSVLPGMKKELPVDTRPGIEESKRQQRLIDGRPTKVISGSARPTTDEAMPAMPALSGRARPAGEAMPPVPSQPAPPAGTRRDANILKLRPTQQINELAFTQHGRNRLGHYTDDFLMRDVVDLWARQTPPEALQNPEAARRALYEWGHRAGLSDHQIRTVWTGFQDRGT